MAADNPVNRNTVHIMDCIDMDQPVQSYAIGLALQNIGMGTPTLLRSITRGMQDRFNLTMIAYANQPKDYSLERELRSRNLLLFTVGDNLEILIYELASHLPHAPQHRRVQHPHPVNTVHIMDCIDMDEPVQSYAISLALQNIGMETPRLLNSITRGMQERFNITMFAYANQQIDYSLEGWICSRNLLLFTVGDNLEILLYEVAPQLPHVQDPPQMDTSEDAFKGERIDTTGS